MIVLSPVTSISGVKGNLGCISKSAANMSQYAFVNPIAGPWVSRVAESTRCPPAQVIMHDQKQFRIYASRAVETAFQMQIAYTSSSDPT